MYNIFNEGLFKNAICYSLIELVEAGDVETFKDFIEKMKDIDEPEQENLFKNTLEKMKKYIEYPNSDIFNNFQLFKTLFSLL